MATSTSLVVVLGDFGVVVVAIVGLGGGQPISSMNIWPNGEQISLKTSCLVASTTAGRPEPQRPSRTTSNWPRAK